MNDQELNKPWWKQLWPWIIISGPLLGFLGAIVTIWLAFTQHVDQPIRDGVIKQGLKVERVSQ